MLDNNYLELINTWHRSYCQFYSDLTANEFPSQYKQVRHDVTSTITGKGKPAFQYFIYDLFLYLHSKHLHSLWLHSKQNLITFSI